MLEEILLKKDELAALCRKHHVRHLAVFGSALRDDFDPARSDIDFRVEFAKVPLDQYAENLWALEGALESLFARRVDLLTSPTIKNRYLRAEIESTQENPLCGVNCSPILKTSNLAISDIEAFAKNKSFAEYKTDRLLQAAVERKFTIIGEAFAQMEQHFPGSRERIVDVRTIVAFRNVLMHQYDEVDLQEVFHIVHAPMLLLKIQINAWILELDPSIAP